MPDGIWSQMFSTGPVVFLERLRCFSSQIAFEYSVRNHGFSRIRAPWAPPPYYCSTRTITQAPRGGAQKYWRVLWVTESVGLRQQPARAGG